MGYNIAYTVRGNFPKETRRETIRKLLEDLEAFDDIDLSSDGHVWAYGSDRWCDLDIAFACVTENVPGLDLWIDYDSEDGARWSTRCYGGKCASRDWVEPEISLEMVVASTEIENCCVCSAKTRSSYSNDEGHTMCRSCYFGSSKAVKAETVDTVGDDESEDR